MRESEYGGEDTDKTQGIQPKDSDASRSGQMSRLVMATDPADEASVPDRYAVPVYRKYDRA